MIPPTIIVTGDKKKGYEFKKFALNQLAILENLMSFQKLNEGFRTIKPYPGIVVECWSSFSQRVVAVHIIKEGKKLSRQNIEEEEYKECFCAPHFAMAEVLKVSPSYPIKNFNPDTELEFSESEESFQKRVDAYNAFLPTGRFAYDLEVCTGNEYVIFLDAFDINCGLYSVGQMVLVTLYNPLDDGTIDCERNCLLDSPRFDSLTISPIHIDDMDKWIIESSTRKIIEE